MLNSQNESRDKLILKLFWLGTIGLLFIYIPKNKVRNGILAFLYQQIITWLFGILVVEKGLIKYPVREFRRAYKGSFSFEYFFYPAFCAIFNLKYPESSSKLLKFLYVIFYTGILTSAETIIKRYTNLIVYVNWKWYWSYITMALTLYSSRLFYRWFFKDEMPN